MNIDQMLEGGITTVIGCLGTDGMTRHMDSVLMKAKALRESGVSAWIYTGSYQVPPPTILGDVGRDIAMIDEVIGVGEIAISDHRSSGPTVDELIRLAGHARVGGMLGGKSGIVNLHMGDATNPFDIIYKVVQMSELTLEQFLPTHCNRNHYIFEDAKTYGKEGFVDITASSYPYFPGIEIKPSEAVVKLLENGVPLEHITMTSDACGSLPIFNDKGKLEALHIGQPKSIFMELKDLVTRENIPLENALKVVTSNIADILQLNQKGRILVGMDADIVMIDNNYSICHLCANGNLMIKDGHTLNGNTINSIS
jgi:beta-aspartyl-dipeptidase (metallo-type)